MVCEGIALVLGSDEGSGQHVFTEFFFDRFTLLMFLVFGENEAFFSQPCFVKKVGDDHARGRFQPGLGPFEIHIVKHQGFAAHFDGEVLFADLDLGKTDLKLFQDPLLVFFQRLHRFPRKEIDGLLSRLTAREGASRRAMRTVIQIGQKLRQWMGGIDGTCSS